MSRSHTATSAPHLRVVLGALLALAPERASSQARPAAPGADADVARAPNVTPGLLCGVPRPRVAPGSYPPDIADRVAVVTGGELVAGTVTRLHASTEPSFGHVASAFVVRIDGEPPVWSYGRGWAGREITYVAADAAQLPRVGERAWFFGGTQIAGTSVVLRETYRLDATVHPSFARVLPSIRAFVADRALYDRAARAALVVLGTVRTVRRVTLASAVVSRHAPVWAEATVAIDGVACGGGPRVATVRFAASDDVARANAPQLVVGQHAVFLLDDDARTGLGGAAYVVDEPLQVAPASAWSRVTQLATTPLALVLPVDPPPPALARAPAAQRDVVAATPDASSHAPALPASSSAPVGTEQDPDCRVPGQRRAFDEWVRGGGPERCRGRIRPGD